MKFCQKPVKEPKQGQLFIKNRKVQLILGQYNDISTKFQDIINNKEVFSRTSIIKIKCKSTKRVNQSQFLQMSSINTFMTTFSPNNMLDIRYSLFELAFLVKKLLQNHQFLQRQEIFHLIFNKVASDLSCFSRDRKEDQCVKLKRRICEVIRVLIGANIVYLYNGCYSATEQGKRKGLAYINVLKEKKRVIKASQMKIISLQQEKAKLIDAIQMMRRLKKKNKQQLSNNYKPIRQDQDEKLYFPWKIVGQTHGKGLFRLEQKFMIYNFIDILSLLRKRQPSLAKK